MKTILFVIISTFCFDCIYSQDNATTTTSPVCPELCSLPSSSGGRGKAPFRMWYFDSIETRECQKFQYTGRKGNQNRFWTKAECEDACTNCAKSTEELNDSSSKMCGLPLSRGVPCPDGSDDVIKIMWRFESEKQDCEPFAYYGCEGNDNKFDSKASCEKSCESKD